MVERVRRGTMRRPLALSLIVLGLVVSLIGGTGLFAPFTDRATTGENSVTTGERPRAADLKLAWAVLDPFACDTETYSDDSTTPGHTATDVQPGFRDLKYFCLRNAGSADLSVSLSVIDRIEDDIACTNDEIYVDTASCGTAPGGGEAGTVLSASFVLFDCELGSGPLPTFLGFLVSDPSAGMGTLAAGDTWCGSVDVGYGLNVPVEAQLAAQSDRITWKYAFDGTT
jgi:predicted ribosomally synthesized peptide with SipW-like signal peptide